MTNEFGHPDSPFRRVFSAPYVRKKDFKPQEGQIWKDADRFQVGARFTIHFLDHDREVTVLTRPDAKGELTMAIFTQRDKGETLRERLSVMGVFPDSGGLVTPVYTTEIEEPFIAERENAVLSALVSENDPTGISQATALLTAAAENPVETKRYLYLKILLGRLRLYRELRSGIDYLRALKLTAQDILYIFDRGKQVSPELYANLVEQLKALK